MPQSNDYDSAPRANRKHMAIEVSKLQPGEYAVTLYNHRLVKVIDFDKRPDGRYNLVVEVGRRGEWLHIVTSASKIVIVTSLEIYNQW